MNEIAEMNITKAIESRIDRSKWVKWKFSDLVDNIVEKVVPKDSGLEHYIGLEHLDTESLKIRRFGEPSSLIGDKLKIYNGDLIFAKRNAYLKRVAIADFDAVASAHSMVLRPKPKNVNPDFLPFFMMSEVFWKRAIEISVGSLSPTINWKALAKQEFLLPPKDQQAQLAELLWAMDEVVEKERKVLNKLFALKLSIREHELANPDFPSMQFKFGLIDIVAGKSLNGTNTPARDDQKGVLKVSAVGKDGFVPVENKVLNRQAEFLERFQVRKGDVLITRANTTELVGRTCFVEEDHPNLMLSDKTLRLDFNDKMDPLYVSELLRSRNARRQIESYATGTGGAMKNITQNEIKALKLPAPAKPTQIMLGKKFQELRQLIVESKNMIASSKGLQKSLINQIF